VEEYGKPEEKMRKSGLPCGKLAAAMKFSTQSTSGSQRPLLKKQAS
jgi:hypothetical protein